MIKQLTIRYEGVYIIWYVQIKNQPVKKKEAIGASSMNMGEILFPQNAEIHPPSLLLRPISKY